jgi:hypothetical protein
MSDPSSIRATLLVLYSLQLEECRRFYSDLGLCFATEQHGQGPCQYAAIPADGAVFDIYPARPGRETGAPRQGLAITGAAARAWPPPTPRPRRPDHRYPGNLIKVNRSPAR